MTVLKQLPVTDYARMIQWILKYAKNSKVWFLIVLLFYCWSFAC